MVSGKLFVGYVIGDNTGVNRVEGELFAFGQTALFISNRRDIIFVHVFDCSAVNLARKCLCGKVTARDFSQAATYCVLEDRSRAAIITLCQRSEQNDQDRNGCRSENAAQLD